MTSVATSATLENPRDLMDLHHRPSTFSDLTFPQPAPWLSSTLAQLWNLEWTGKDIEGLGDLRISPLTAIRVRKLLFKIGGTRALPSPRVRVLSGGGVSLNWSVGPREVKYIFWPEGVFTYEKESGGDIVDENEVQNDDSFDPTEPIGWLLNA